MRTLQESGAIPIENLNAVVEDVLNSTDFVDMHTHLFSPGFGNLGLWGFDDLLTYHYLEAELFRNSPITPEQYFALDKASRADAIWKALFVENSPISEASRGVIAVLRALGLDPAAIELGPIRAWFREQEFDSHISRVFRRAGITSAVMTNDPLDPAEAAAWKKGVHADPRFYAALRLDRITNEWTQHVPQLAAQGYAVEPGASGKSMAEARRFLDEWCARAKPVYMAMSLPDSFFFPAQDVRTKLLSDAVLPACRDHRIPLALMIGIRRQVNPRLRLAGDAAGRADLRSLENLCRDFPQNRFLVSVLSRENQHELCVYARKFNNLMPFGCWWFLNNPSVVEEVTRERLEMLGISFIPQHSDARILEQVLYKWQITRTTIAPLLAKAYRQLSEQGRPVTEEDIRRDVTRLFRGNFDTVTK